MRAIFIGGPMHGETWELQDDTKSFLAAAPTSEGPGTDTVLYLKRTWWDQTRGDTTMMVASTATDAEVADTARLMLRTGT